MADINPTHSHSVWGGPKKKKSNNGEKGRSLQLEPLDVEDGGTNVMSKSGQGEPVDDVFEELRAFIRLVRQEIIPSHSDFYSEQ